MSYCAELDAEGVVLRVVVAPSVGWCVENLGGVWRETSDPYAEPTWPRYCAPGFRWDEGYGQFFPWSVDTPRGTLWCLAPSWAAVDPETQEAFFAETGLSVAVETLDGVDYVVFGGRAITEDDQIAITEVLPMTGRASRIGGDELRSRSEAVKASLPKGPAARRAVLKARLDAKGVVVGGPGGEVDGRVRSRRDVTP